MEQVIRLRLMADTRWLNPEETQTWLNMWGVTQWLTTRLDEQLKKDSGVSLSDYFVLAQISLAPDARLTMSDLAAVADMSPSRLSHTVARLEKRGWVSREQSETDRRTNIAVLLPAGQEFLDQAAPGHVECARSYIFDPLTPEEAGALGTSLGKILDALDPPTLPRA
ncbi:transcription factor [Corynebacterium renale]|uniref:DNA-binding MarR family transcriptional regulator n=2 Tax=Corynebacterium renale TaxID=1724 RepID=A0A2A9DQK5_9CORY|nr:DNA-binding MarR family transcriptional regulator [Corynebacterium renale]SQI19481.1 transcription factor [Corynebacterium renale]